MRLVVVAVLAVLMVGGAQPAVADKRLDDAVKKANTQLAKGKEAEAVAILQKAVSQAPRDPEAPLALAAMCLRLGKLDEASAALGKAGDLAGAAPANVKARVRTAQSAFALRAGTVGAALDLAREAVAAEATPEALAALARAQARWGDTVAARETADRAVKAGPDAAASAIARGDALLSARLASEAEAAYRAALAKDRGSVLAASGLARALAAEGKGSAALDAAKQAVASDARSGEAQAAMARAALALDPDDKKSEAAAAAYQAASLEPKSALVQVELGRTYASRGQTDEARAAYLKAAELDPTWPLPRVAALGLELDRGDAKAALSGLRALPEPMQAAGEADLLLGRLLAKQEDWTGASAALDRAALAFPGLAEAHALRGTAAYNAGDLTAAADAYGRAVTLDPVNRAYLFDHALYLSYDGRREEGLAALLEATGRPDGQTPDAFMRLASIYRSFRPPRVAEAVAAYEKVRKLDPKNGQAALGIAETYREGRQWARAISAYQNVEQSFPRLAGEAQLGTAWSYYWSGDDSKARFYTTLAVRSGADVEGIRQAFGRPPATGAAADLAELRDDLRSKSAGVQARAVVGLVELGRPAVGTLAEALARKGTTLAVRERIVLGLGTLGPAAREALPQLERLAKSTTPDEQRLVAAAQASIARIRAGSVP